MIKICLLILTATIFGYLGFGLSLYYTNRSKFFKNLELLFEKLNLDINFSRRRLIELIQAFETQNKDIKKLSCNFIRCLEYDLEIDNETLFKDIKILNDEEKNVICMFFKSLGKLDVYNQTKQLTNQKEEISKLHKVVEEEAKKYAPLYLKIGIILGLIVVLLFA